MKNRFCMLVFLITNVLSGFAQSDTLKRCELTKEFIQSLANPDTHSALKQKWAAAPTTASINCGRFQITFEDVTLADGYGFNDPVKGTYYQQCACDVANYIQSVINIPAGDGTPIQIFFNQSWISPTNPVPAGINPSTLAIGGPIFTTMGAAPGFYGGNVYEHMTTGNDPDPANIDGQVTVNFNYYYRACNEARDCSKYDLYSILLHEFTHALGWLSGLQESAAFFPESTWGGFRYSKYDQYFLYYGNIQTGPLTHIIDATNPLAPFIDPSIPANALTSRDVWYTNVLEDDLTRNQNCPTFGIEAAVTASNAPNTISHFGAYQDGFDHRSHFAPGFIPEWSMGPYFEKDWERNTYTLQELRYLNTMGYSFNPSFLTSSTIHPPNANATVINNIHPYTTKLIFDESWYQSTVLYNLSEIDDNTYTPAEYTISNCQNLTIDLSADPRLKDANGDPIRVFPGSLYNIRGCGIGGNNSNALAVTSSPAGDVITYTPRANFAGRAQFGFCLYDGLEKGAFMIYTIDVTNCNPCFGSNMIINGDFEEGMQIKTVTTPNVDNSAFFDIQDLKYLGDVDGVLPDGMVYTNNNFVFVKESSTCDPAVGYFGMPFRSWSPGSAPASVSGTGGDRYLQLVECNSIFTLCSPATHCTRYTAEFDYNSANPETLTFGFTNTPAGQGTPITLNSPTAAITLPATGGTWQHFSIPVNYCSAAASGYFVIENPSFSFSLLIDNLDVHVTTFPPVFGATITPASPTICSGGTVTLTATASNPLCTPSYTWTPGGATATSISVSPASTTAYSVSVYDGCSTVTASTTVTVSPAPVATFSYSGSPFCTTGTNPSPVFSGGGTAGTFSSSPGLVFVSTSTGQINLLASTPGVYVVTNSIAASGGCPSATATTTITIVACSTICTTCTPLGASGTISASPAPKQVYCINNNVTISGSVTIALSEVKMGAGWTITVPSGSTLTISGSHIYSCGDMWQGIKVLPGGAVVVQLGLTIFPLPPFIRTSLIEDAKVAIDIPSNASVTNNPLTVANSIFNRNAIAIHITNYSRTSGPLTYPMSITNTVFTCRNLPFAPNSLAWVQTGTLKMVNPVPVLQSPYIDNVLFPTIALKAPLGGFAQKGIFIERVGSTAMVTPPATPAYHEMQVGAPGAPQFNIFDNLIIDIDAIDANFTCENNVFQNNPVSQKGGVAINANSTPEANVRLRVIPAAATNFFNQFFDCYRAVNSVNYYENQLTYSDVRSTFASTAPTLGASPHLGKDGFFVQTNRYLTMNISNNSIYNIENPIAFIANYGSFVLPTVPSPGQYSGQVNININTIRPHLPGNTVTTQYIYTAITAQNVIGTGIVTNSGTVNINSNILTDVYRGIGAANWTRKDLNCNGNTIGLLSDPFFFTPTGSTTTPLQYGIGNNKDKSLTGPLGNSIMSNGITGPGITANPNFYCILVNLCQGTHVKCNNTSSTTKGIAFLGINTPASFNHNTMSGQQYGFVLDNAGFIGIQGSSTNPTDNRWTGTWTPPNFKTATLATTTSSTAIGSELYVRSLSGPTYNPNGSGFTATGLYGVDDYYYNTSSPGSGTIRYISNNPLVTACPVVFHISHPALISSLEKVALDLQPLVNNIAETRYINRNQLYRMLKEDPSLLTGSSILQNFYTASTGTAREAFAEIEDDMSMGDLANGQSKIAAVSPQNTIENNYKMFYEAYVKQQTDSITPADSLQLFGLASGCPFIDGEVVYQARALYNSIYMNNVLFIDNCNAGRRFEPDNKISKPSFSVNLFPNPNPGEFTLEFSSEAQWLIEIRDIQGRILLKESTGNRVLKLKPDAENGVYLVQITNLLSNETLVKKLVIQK